jgi:hypothetical protein
MKFPPTLNGQWLERECVCVCVCSKDHNRWFFADSFRKVLKYNDPSNGRILFFWRSFGFRSDGIEGGLNSHGMKELSVRPFVRPSFFLSVCSSVRQSFRPSVLLSVINLPIIPCPIFRFAYIYIYFFLFFFIFFFNFIFRAAT